MFWKKIKPKPEVEVVELEEFEPVAQPINRSNEVEEEPRVPALVLITNNSEFMVEIGTNEVQLDQDVIWPLDAFVSLFVFLKNTRNSKSKYSDRVNALLDSLPNELEF